MYKNASIQKKMTIASLFVTMLPMLLMECIFFLLIQQATLEEFKDSAGVYVGQLEENYTNELDKLEHLAGTLADFSMLEDYLTREFENRAESFHYYSQNIHPILDNCNNAYEGIRVRIYHNHKGISNFSFELSNGLDGLFQQGILDEEKLSSDGQWQKSNIRYNTYEPVYSYYRAVREKGGDYGISYVISLHMDENSFYTQIANQPVEAGLVFVMDQEGRVITSNQRSQGDKTTGEQADGSGLALQNLEDWQRLTYEGNAYIVIQRKTQDLHIVYLMSYSNVWNEMQRYMWIMILAGLVLLGLSYLLMMGISREITSGIHRLHKKMQNIDRKSIRSIASLTPDVNSRDEVVQLDAVFMEMMAQIDNLIDTAAKREQTLKDEIIARQRAEIQALQHQIDPHYLFNTLEALRMNLILREDRENAEIVRLFSEGFRRYMDMRNEYVTLFEEVEFIHKYIRIQNYRLNNRITFDTDIEGNALGYRVLKLLLQPLVENAVCHGLEAKGGNGRILLTIRREMGGLLFIIVEDDGAGMDEEQLRALRAMVYGGQQEESVALHNVYDRIRLVYGDEANLTIDSVQGKGTKVLLQLPIRLLEERVCIGS
ncbi:MAG: histidine kinase [Lachnospiraceae bacterium]|nr:histidine kinase [Lachnospiraceae bacterium]